MRKLPALGQTCGWVRTSGSHLQGVCALLPEAPLQLPLGMESSAKLGPGSGDYGTVLQFCLGNCLRSHCLPSHWAMGGRQKELSHRKEKREKKHSPGKEHEERTTPQFLLL